MGGGGRRGEGVRSPLALNILYHTKPDLLCSFEVKNMRGLQCIA